MHSALPIRAYAPADLAQALLLWFNVNRAAYWYNATHQAHTIDDGRAHFCNVVLRGGAVWLAVDGDTIAGLTAVSATHVMQMAVRDAYRRRGVASALLRHALANAPTVDRLYTFQRNTAARALYERHGFVVDALGVSPAPELEADVLYRLPPEARARLLTTTTQGP